MKNITWIFCSLYLFAGATAFADDLLPATSEDAAQFDAQLAMQNDHGQGKPDPKTRKDNFGKLVSDEAKKLKADGQKSHFGAWVSSQRRQNAQNVPGANADPGRDMGQGNAQAGPDARSGSGNAGGAGSGNAGGNSGSSSSPGQSGSHNGHGNGHGNR